MSTFDELKKQAEVKVKADEAAAISWIKAHRGWLLVIVALAVGFFFGKL